MIQASFHIVVPAGKRAEVLDLLLCLKGPTEVSGGCCGCQILQDVENENALTCLQQWNTLEDVEEHLRSERFRKLLPYTEMSSIVPTVVDLDAGEIKPPFALDTADLLSAICPRRNRSQGTVPIFAAERTSQED